MVININQRVRVKLTESGKGYAKQYFSDHRMYYSLEQIEKDDIQEFQLWDLMNIFGPAMFLGGPTQFENCEIEVIEERIFVRLESESQLQERLIKL